MKMIHLSLFRYCLATFLLLSLNCSYAFKRHIKCVVHSEYIDTGDNRTFNLIHVSAEGAADTVHFLWSSYRLPSAIVARTTRDTVLVINYDKLSKLEAKAIQFSKEPLAITGLTISELWELSYDSDTSDINDALSVSALGLESFNWSNVTNATFCSASSASLDLKASNKNENISLKDQTFGVEFSVIGEESKAPNFPHLIYSGNSTQVRVILDQLHSNSSKTRYGLGLQFFSSVSEHCPKSRDCTFNKTNSITDEFSPGVFWDVDVSVPCSQPDPEKGNFLTWRPVAYTTTKPGVANSLDVNLSEGCPNGSIAATPQSIAELYFGDQLGSLVNVFNVTFGTEGDGFYRKTEYATWSLMLGTGLPVHQTTSVTVLVSWLFGAGVIAFFLLSGAVFLLVQRCRKKNDDLLLSDNHVN